MRNGTPVIDLRECKGLIRGIIVAGQDQRGEPITKALHWYPDGRMTPARETPYDLDLTADPAPRGQNAYALARRFGQDARDAEADAAVDDWLDDLPF